MLACRFTGYSRKYLHQECLSLSGAFEPTFSKTDLPELAWITLIIDRSSNRLPRKTAAPKIGMRC